MALQVYGGELAPPSAKSHDLVAPDGRLIQVKARTVGATTGSGSVFSAFRSFDFEIATLLVLDSRTYDLRWVRELSPEEVRDASRWSSHVNGYLLQVRKAEALGTDVTELFAPEFSAAN